MKSQTDRYGSVAVTLHWLSAAAIFTLIGSGFAAALANDPATRLAVLQVHVPLALLTLALTLGRIAWWLFIDRKPKPIAGVPAVQAASARTVHRLLYGVLLVLFASGIALLVLSGASGVILGGTGVLPDFTAYAPHMAHLAAALVLVALLVAHIGAALYHQLVRRDAIFARMWYRRSQ